MEAEDEEKGERGKEAEKKEEKEKGEKKLFLLLSEQTLASLSVFTNKVLLEHGHTYPVYGSLPRQSRTAVIETIWPTRPNASLPHLEQDTWATPAPEHQEQNSWPPPCVSIALVWSFVYLMDACVHCSIGDGYSMEDRLSVGVLLAF